MNFISNYGTQLTVMAVWTWGRWCITINGVVKGLGSMTVKGLGLG